MSKKAIYKKEDIWNGNIEDSINLSEDDKE